MAWDTQTVSGTCILSPAVGFGGQWAGHTDGAGGRRQAAPVGLWCRAWCGALWGVQRSPGQTRMV